MHWLVNAGYHVTARQLRGIYTSNELPHFIRTCPTVSGQPALGALIAEAANEDIVTRAHADTTLDLEYGTLVPMRYMNADQHFRVVSVAGWCNWHRLDESRRFGASVRRAIEQKYDGTVAIFASGSLSHRFNDNGSPESAIHEISDEFFRRSTCAWSSCGGDWKTFVRSCPSAARWWARPHARHRDVVGHRLHAYDWPIETIAVFASSGTGQINAIFPL